MKLNVRTLMVDGSVVKSVEVAPKYRKVSSAMVNIGTRLRKQNGAVAACRCDEMTEYTWTGHSTPQHDEAKIKAERENQNW